MKLDPRIASSIEGGRLVSAVLSDPSGGPIRKVGLRPIILREHLAYQFESIKGTQAHHENLTPEQTQVRIETLLDTFRQGQFFTAGGDFQMNGGTVRVRPASKKPAPASHDRTKEYIIPEGTPCDFMVRLGIMAPDGKVRAAKQAKFRQVNRFLEMVDDVADSFKDDVIGVDFGSGKSYLTFALYHYLTRIRGLKVRITGLDLKKDVVAECEALARELKYEGLAFRSGDIAGFDGPQGIDLVVMLHACDTATDDGLAKAVSWRARVILAAPCCQHELRDRIHNEALLPMLKHGLVRERLAALVTDSFRAAALESAGYAVQMLEFIDMEHTPKNLLIRAVLKPGKPGTRVDFETLRKAFKAAPSKL